MSEASKSSTIVSDRLGPSTVDEVRKIRAQIDEACDGDIHRLADYARKAAEEFRQRQVRRES